MLHKMTKNGALPRSRAEADLKLLEQPEVNRRELTEQLRSGCRIRKRDDQTYEELIESYDWQQRNAELADMYDALTGQAMDCLLRTIPEDEQLPHEEETEIDAMLEKTMEKGSTKQSNPDVTVPSSPDTEMVAGGENSDDDEENHGMMNTAEDDGERECRGGELQSNDLLVADCENGFLNDNFLECHDSADEYASPCGGSTGWLGED